MRGAGRFPKLFWAGKEFVRTISAVVAGAPLRGVLVLGGVFVPVWAAVATVVMVWDGWPGDEARARTAGRWWVEGGGGG